MANKTVYPFGTDGTLPGAIRIINDFTTGGADKAASAETVKTLHSIMYGTPVAITTEYDLTVLNRIDYYIAYTGVWHGGGTAEQSVDINVVGVIKITVAMDGNPGSFSFLRNLENMKNEGTPSFATGETGRHVVADGDTEEFYVPADAVFLVVTVHTSQLEIADCYTITAETTGFTGGFIARSEIVDNLDSDNDSVPLSAKQGKILDEKIVASRLAGKKVSVVGDSISCFGTEAQVRSGQYITPYFKVLDGDVGNTIQSYVTYLDVWTSIEGTTRTNKTIGGVTLTPEMIGTKQNFVPVANDVGKCIGVPRWSGQYTTKPWWQVFCEETGAVMCANASWSGSRIVPIPEGNSRHDAFVLSELYSDYTIDRLAGRADDGTAINPDIIIIYRGTNDFSADDIAGPEDLETPDMMTFTTITDAHNLTQGYIYAILKIRAKYPNAAIFLCTLNVFKRVNYSHFPTNNGEYTLPDYNNKIREIADLMGCGIVELDKDGITFENCYPTYISDNATTPTHPNATGHGVMGRKAANDVKYYLP